MLALVLFALAPSVAMASPLEDVLRVVAVIDVVTDIPILGAATSGLGGAAGEAADGVLLHRGQAEPSALLRAASRAFAKGMLSRISPEHMAGHRAGSLRSEQTVFGPSIGNTVLVAPGYYCGTMSFSVSW